MKHIWTIMYLCTLNIFKKQGVDKDLSTPYTIG